MATKNLGGLRLIVAVDDGWSSPTSLDISFAICVRSSARYEMSS